MIMYLIFFLFFFNWMFMKLLLHFARQTQIQAYTMFGVDAFNENSGRQEQWAIQQTKTENIKVR